VNEFGAIDTCAVKVGHSGIERPSVRRFQKLLDSQLYVIQLRKKQNYAFKHIGYTDGTAVYFDMPRDYTADAKGAKENYNHRL
jgi:hypothetical protein